MMTIKLADRVLPLIKSTRAQRSGVWTTAIFIALSLGVVACGGDDSSDEDEELGSGGTGGPYSAGVGGFDVAGEAGQGVAAAARGGTSAGQGGSDEAGQGGSEASSEAGQGVAGGTSIGQGGVGGSACEASEDDVFVEEDDAEQVAHAALPSAAEIGASSFEQEDTSGDDSATVLWGQAGRSFDSLSGDIRIAVQIYVLPSVVYAQAIRTATQADLVSESFASSLENSIESGGTGVSATAVKGELSHESPNGGSGVAYNIAVTNGSSLGVIKYEDYLWTYANLVVLVSFIGSSASLSSSTIESALTGVEQKVQEATYGTVCSTN